MNLLGTHNIQAGAKGTKSTGNVLDMLGSQLELNPEALQLLQESGHLKGKSFENILAAADEGQSTDQIIAMINAQGGDVSADQLKELVADNGQLAKQAQTQTGLQVKNSDQNLEQIIPTTDSISPEQMQKAEVLNNGNRVAPKVEQGMNRPGLNTETPKTNQLQDSDNLLALRNMSRTSQQPKAYAEKQKSIFNVNPEQAPQVAEKNVTANNNLKNFNDFMQAQSPAMRQNAAKKAYKPVSDSIFAKKVDASLPHVAKAPVKEVTLQDVMLGQDMEQDLSSQSESFAGMKQMNNSTVSVGNTSAPKVFNMNALNNPQNIDEVINQIQDYVVKANAINKQEVQMSFHHDELGKVDLFVQKTANNQLNIGINTNTTEGSKFFTQHQTELLNSLNQSGLSVRDMKLDSSQSSQQNFAQSDSSKQDFGQGTRGQHQSQSGQRQEESERRQELWRYYQDKEAA